ncbi:hypothetical protein ACJRO7_011222 [Eucalyptus globulus]|uniref:Uncharacterized protein n=1 Tax=Eucalyptus globulus TaxID=34317 RepID=A0ABD3LJZ1_EUCGL
MRLHALKSEWPGLRDVQGSGFRTGQEGSNLPIFDQLPKLKLKPRLKEMRKPQSLIKLKRSRLGYCSLVLLNSTRITGQPVIVIECDNDRAL